MMERYALMVVCVWFLIGSIITGVVGVLLCTYGAWFGGIAVIGSGFASGVMGIAMAQVWMHDGFRSVLAGAEGEDEDSG